MTNPIDDNWKHRSQGMKCGSCMWFIAKHYDAPKQVNDRVLGRCRRHAPSYNSNIGWPPVFDTDWCGDHKLDENKV